MLRVRNGGTAHFGTFHKEGVPYPLGAAMFGVGPKAAPFDLVEAYRRRADFETPDAVVLFSSEGHESFGLDYRQAPAAPAVVYAVDDAEPTRLTDTFAAFFAALVADG